MNSRRVLSRILRGVIASFMPSNTISTVSGRGDRFADIDGARYVVGEPRSGHDAALGDRAFEHLLLLGDLAVDLFLLGGRASASAMTARTSLSAACQSSVSGAKVTKVASAERLTLSCWTCA